MRTEMRSRDERGAFAVVFALMVVMLLTIAALGTDLGNAISRKTDTQNQADFAAFDAGQEFAVQIASAPAGSPVPPDVVLAVADSFNNNQPQDDDNSCWRDNDCVSTTQLTNCTVSPVVPAPGCYADGEVEYVAEGLQVIAPQARVDFGFANVFGANGTSVQSSATVNVFSAGPRVLPMFAVAGCDYGRQTLTDPAHTPASGVPTLYEHNQNGGADLEQPPAIYSPANATVLTVPTNGSGYVMWISATDWDKTWQIGFFPSDGGEPVVLEGPDLRKTDDSAWTYPIDNAPSTIELTIPTTVTGTEGLWYVRARGGRDVLNPPNGQPNKWSPGDEAVPIRIGEPLLECDASHPGGNFGTLRLPRTDQPSLDIPMNIATGLEEPLNLVVHPWGRNQHLTNASWDGTCDPADSSQDAVYSHHNTLLPDSNCVDTDPGLPANSATAGFITGPRSGATKLAPGLLDKDTLCDRNGGTARTGAITIQGDDYHLNDDVLTCFLTGGKSLADIASPTYAGGPALTADVMKSPRFAWVPVLDEGGASGPDHGSSRTYSIVDYRPAFITDEQATASAVKGASNATPENGVFVDGNDLKQIKVVFFNIDALPRDGDLPLIDYLGVGDPIVHLID